MPAAGRRRRSLLRPTGPALKPRQELDQNEPNSETFRDNAIDETVLPSLTVEDLKDLGVGIVGHRRKLLDAIAALRAKVPPAAALPAIDKTPVDTAERRQVTVMFSDLVGSTALSTRMDPEDLREIISAYQQSVVETVHRFDGFVARYCAHVAGPAVFPLYFQRAALAEVPAAGRRVAWPKLPRASSTLPALSSGGLENERTTPRATFRRGQLSLQSNVRT